MQRKCLHTGEVFKAHRYNQKFKDRSSQIAFNNEIARKKRAIKNPVDRVLDKNRTILIKILGNESSVTKSQDYLLGAGFNFKFFNQSLMYDKKPCQVIYEFIIISNGDKTYTIKKLTS